MPQSLQEKRMFRNNYRRIVTRIPSKSAHHFPVRPS
jgi:hypothetical protein